MHGEVPPPKREYPVTEGNIRAQKKMFLFVILFLVVIFVLGFLYTLIARPKDVSGLGYKEIVYEINGQEIQIKDNVRYFGNGVFGDLDGNMTNNDVAFLITDSPGGSGTFYYVVAAILGVDGYHGTNAVLLGDRIAPQTTEFRDGEIIVNYADRKVGEPMTAQPSVGISKYFKIVNNKLVEVKK